MLQDKRGPAVTAGNLSYRHTNPLSGQLQHITTQWPVQQHSQPSTSTAAARRDFENWQSSVIPGITLGNRRHLEWGNRSLYLPRIYSRMLLFVPHNLPPPPDKTPYSSHAHVTPCHNPHPYPLVVCSGRYRKKNKKQVAVIVVVFRTRTKKKPANAFCFFPLYRIENTGTLSRDGEGGRRTAGRRARRRGSG